MSDATAPTPVVTDDPATPPPLVMPSDEPGLQFDLSDPTLQDASVYEWLSKRGPYGEIYPPILDGNAPPEAMLTALDKRNQQLGEPIHVPSHGKSRVGLTADGVLLQHALGLRRVAAGVLFNDEEAALHLAIERGERISLRPPMQEALVFSTFAPVMARLGHDRWRLGVSEYGNTAEVVDPDPQVAVGRLQSLRQQWTVKDYAVFEQELDTALEALPASLFLDCWQDALTRDRQWEAAPGYWVRLLGNHDNVQVFTPAGARNLETTRQRAVRIAAALALKGGAQLTYPDAAALNAWLDEITAPAAPTQVEWAPDEDGLPAIVTTEGGPRFALVRRGNNLVCHRLDGNAYVGVIGESAIVGPLADWLKGDPTGRAVLTRWVVWRETQQPKKRSKK
jgi:hypothetical protein